jgi:peptidoglycan/LPS O-acetylase OafA/YrhL
MLASVVIVGPFTASQVVAYLASPIVFWFLLGMGLATLWYWSGFEEPEWFASRIKFIEPLGDASYSTYLIHGFVLTMLLRFWVKIIGQPSIWIVPISLIVATAAGWFIYVVIEKPLLRTMSNIGKPRQSVVAT